jgi:acetolactate synthase-1/2/3 large subunit
VEYVFVLCGNGLQPFLEACHGSRLKIVDVRNEQAASYMADLWGRMTGRLGVVAVSSGPGHTNALTGLANAAWDGGPMLLLSGCSEWSTKGLDHFQELDQVGMVEPICKYASLVDRVDHLERKFSAALFHATAHRPGPVHLTIPMDVLRAECKAQIAGAPARVGQGPPPDGTVARQVVAKLHRATRPLIVAGSGVFYAGAGGLLQEFAELTSIPVLTQMWDRGDFPQAFPEYVGVASSEVNGAMSLFNEADVVLTVGARVDYRLGHGQPPVCRKGVEFIRIDADPAEVHRALQPALGMVADPYLALEEIISCARELEWHHGDWLARVQAAREEFLQRWTDFGWEDGSPLPAIRLCREIKAVLDERDPVFLLDGGNIGRWAHMFLFDRHPAHWLTCGASGVVGWGLPGAIAAKLAHPDRPVLLLSGDGSAGFTVTEIQTALRFHTPYVAVIADDSAWGIVVDGQREDKRIASELGELRFDLVAKALGARGIYVDRPDMLRPAIEEALAMDTVTIIQVPVQQGGIARMASMLRD